MRDTTKLPRLYTSHDLDAGNSIDLDEGAAHYLRTVLRRQPGDKLRIFNGRNGEWLAEIQALGKKSVALDLLQQTREQPLSSAAIHLIFSPIKKNRMDFLIEKAVELGATDLHPVITAHAEVRKINAGRISAQIIEAAEQSERLDIPTLHPLCTLDEKLTRWNGDTIFWCLERAEAPLLAITEAAESCAFLIGPEGGFSDREIGDLRKYSFIRPVSLGSRILRSETACLVCLSHVQ